MRRTGSWVAVLAAVGVAFWLFGRWAAEWLALFVAWVDGLGALAPVAFIVGYAITTVALIPGSLLTIAAGVLFGVVRGTAYAFVGATLGSALAFLTSRYLARRAVKRRLVKDARFERIDRAIGKNGFRVVLLLRLSPLFPFTLLNYALGVTRVRFLDYLAASVGMLPATWLYVYNGKLVGEVAGVSSGTMIRHTTGYYVILALGLAATIAVTLWITRAARRALR